MEALIHILTMIYENVELFGILGTALGSVLVIIQSYRQKGLKAAIEALVKEKDTLEDALKQVWDAKANAEAKLTSTIIGIESAEPEAGKIVKKEVEKISTKLGVADDLHKATRDIPLLSEVYRRNKTVRTAADILKTLRRLL